MTYRDIGCLGLAVALTASAGVVHPARAAKLVVAANGIDGAACGAAASPCRSINRAIANAAAGDTIEVGPGRYGDLNRDGDLDDPGDEVAATCLPVVCMIDVVKPVTIVSRRGASVTMLDGGRKAGTVVRVAASGAVFGKKSKGFTLLDSNSEGILVDGGSRITIAGNVSLGSPAGFRIMMGDHHTIEANRALDNGGVGFEFFGGVGHTITRNAAVGNGALGFNFASTDALVTRNVAVGNGTGIAINVAGVFAFDGPRLSTNVVTGNLHAGVSFGPFSASSAGIGPMTLTGNGTDGSNCGVLNGTTTVIATGVFWGSPLGPGPDPADDVCNVVGSTITTGPASTEVGFNLPAQR
jgi:hypothetical protein